MHIGRLITKFNCIGIKTSLEDEGACLNDITRLRHLTAKNGIKLSVKIGGPEAKTDIKLASELCCDSIVGPMIETKYALEKYIDATDNIGMPRGINIETITAINNLDLLLSIGSNIDYFTIGRVDLVGSMGISRSEIDSPDIMKIVTETFRKVKVLNKPTYMGGSISKSSRAFVENLYYEGLLDYVETRYIIMKLTPELFEVWDEAITSAHEFEYQWMEYLGQKAHTLAKTFHKRTELVKPRIHRSFVIDETTVTWDPADMSLDAFDIKTPASYRVSFSDKLPEFRDGDFVIIDKNLRKYIGTRGHYYEIDAVEKNKNINTVMSVISHMSKPTRVVVIGGGIVQDIGAFVSTIFNRGIEWVYWPTTLLSMADSCIGSKSSLNGDFSKNNIGTFSSPSEVIINTQFLNTLSARDIASGKGEILKLCIIGGALDIYEKSSSMTDLIKVSLLIKRAVIERDPYDKGIRRALNYGHTIGHAVEYMSDYAIPHGVSVVFGILSVNRVFGYCDTKVEKLCYDLIEGLSVNFDFSSLKRVLLEDKKVTGNSLKFIVPISQGNFKFETREVSDILCETIKDSFV